MAEEIKFKLGLDLKNAQKAMNTMLGQATKLGKSLGKVGKSIGSVFIKNLKSAATGLTKIGKLAGGGLGLGLLAGGFSKLSEGMGANEKVQRVLNTTMNLFIGIANGVIGVLEPLFNWFFKAFTEPKKWWDELVTSFTSGVKWIKENMIDYVLAGLATMLDKLTVQFLEVRKAWNEFTGDTKEADEIGKKIEEINTQIDERNKKQEERAKNVKGVVSDVVKFVSDSAKQIAKEVTNVMSNNEALLNFEKNMGRLEIAYQEIIEKYDKQAEVQRQLRDDENKTIEERLKANEELGKILEQQATEEKANIEERKRLAEENMAILGYSWDREKEILELKKELNAVDAKITGFQSEQLINQNALLKEQVEIRTSEKETAIEILDMEMEIALAKETNAAKTFEIQREYAEKNHNLQMDLYDSQLKELTKGTAAYQDVVNAKLKADKEYQLKKANIDKEEKEYKIESDKAEVESEQAKQDAKLAAFNQVTDALKSVVGENAKLALALDISQAIANTYAGATKAYAQGGTLGFISAGAVIAAGMVNVKKMIDEANKVGQLVGGGGSTASASASIGPSIGLVNSVSNNNAQLMASIEGSMSKPPRAYVVSTDVDTQQSLNRKVRQNATLSSE